MEPSNKDVGFFEIAQLVAFEEGGKCWQQLVRLLDDRFEVVFDKSTAEEAARLMLQAISMPEVCLFVMILTAEGRGKVSFKSMPDNGIDAFELPPLKRALLESELEKLGWHHCKSGAKNVVAFKDGDGYTAVVVFDDAIVEAYITTT